MADETLEERFRRYGVIPPKPDREPPDNVIPINAEIGADRERRYALGKLRAIADELATTSTNRNQELNKLAFKLTGEVRDGRLTREEVEDALIDAARLASLLGDHPFTDTEVRATLKSAFNGGDTKQTTPTQPRGNPINPAYTIDTPAPHAAPFDAIFDAEHDFWTARESLQQIFTAAMARMCSPWAVLAHCAARALTQVRPNIVLPPIIGGPGSLNWFAAIAAISGGGKGSASATARELIPTEIRTRNLGSGEGIIGAFHRPGTAHQAAEIHEAVMFLADEIDTIAALGSRTGSTTMSILRSGFSGETLGFSYITRGRDIHLDAHTYRMTLVISVQPARAGTLMDDHGGGTPQRFMWFPGTDKRLTTDTPYVPGALTLPAPGEWQYPRQLKIPPEAEELIKSERVKAARGVHNALDGHALFCREKFAFALTIMDGRTEMTSEDWRLAGIASEISARTRTWVSQLLSRATEDEAAERGRLMGVSHSASEEEKTYRADQRGQRLARWALERLAGGPLGNREIHKAVANRDRPWLKGALDGLVAAGLIGRDEQKRWVKL